VTPTTRSPVGWLGGVWSAIGAGGRGFLAASTGAATPADSTAAAVMHVACRPSLRRSMDESS
jgi:hypothetical protein